MRADALERIKRLCQLVGSFSEHDLALHLNVSAAKAREVRADAERAGIIKQASATTWRLTERTTP